MKINVPLALCCALAGVRTALALDNGAEDAVGDTGVAARLVSALSARVSALEQAAQGAEPVAAVQTAVAAATGDNDDDDDDDEDSSIPEVASDTDDAPTNGDDDADDTDSDDSDSSSPLFKRQAWGTKERTEQLRCLKDNGGAAGIAKDQSLRDCDTLKLTPLICQDRCTCWNGRVKCDGWSKCSPDTMTQVCTCRTRDSENGRCDEPGAPCVCRRKV